MKGVIVADVFAEATISNKTLAIIVNDRDPVSIAVAKYYQQKRLIPDEHVVHVSFDNNRDSLTAIEFEKINSQVKSKLTNKAQAYVLTWSRPYKVDCMSITSAFALGFDKKYCAKGCIKTETVDYYNSNSSSPYDDFMIRPTMMLAGYSQTDVFELINRGVAADYSRPDGHAYLLSTSDKQRNVRSSYYPYAVKNFGKLIDVTVEQKDYISGKSDILFYFTGLKKVDDISSNNFLPGAIADHLTSTGGVLFNGRQMSALKWLDAGITGSYGTVVEPCNFLGKFPNPVIVMKNYLNGDSLIESYWKSVSMPGQGLFVGEPLASPYKGCSLKFNKQTGFKYTDTIPKNHVLRSSASCSRLF